MKRIYFLIISLLLLFSSAQSQSRAGDELIKGQKGVSLTDLFPQPETPVLKSAVGVLPPQACQINALVLYCSDVTHSALQTNLMATGKFTAVDMYNFMGDLTLLNVTLQDYDAVFVWMNDGGFDFSAVKTKLQNYMEAGGGVVTAVASSLNPYWNIGLDEPYQVKLPTPDLQYTGGANSLGTVYNAVHPILQDITSITESSALWEFGTSLNVNAERIADWSNGEVLAAVREDVGGNDARRVDLNFFPFDGNLSDPGSFLLIANSLTWASKKCDCPDVVVDNDEGLCGAVVTYPDPSPVGATVAQIDATGLTSGDTFPVGVTVQQYEFDYGEGLKDTCTFTVTVNDTEAPVISCNPDTVFSNIRLENTVVYDNNSGSLDYGTDIHTFNFTDPTPAGTVVTKITVGMTVYYPHSSAVAQNDVFLNNDLIGRGYPTFPIGNKTYTVSKTNPVYVKGGTNTLRLDTWWNAVRFISAVITIEYEARDGCFGIVSLTPPVADDNCSYTIVNDYNHTSSIANDTFALGVTPVYWFAIDAFGNTDSCVQNVTVNDIVSPVALGKDVMVYLDSTGSVTMAEDFVDSSSYDLCSDLTYDTDITEFSCSDVGEENVVILTVTDEYLNTDSCIARVTVLDTLAPEAICQSIAVFLDENGSAAITAADIDLGSVDNCGIDTLLLDKYTFDCSEIGDNIVELTVADLSGNSSLCTATVTVNDTEGPVVECNGTGGLGKAAYVSSNTGEPWGVSSNIDAMNQAFGAGNWDHLYYQTVDANTLISGEYDFIYMDGGATNDIPMKTFIDANIGDLEAWVSAGGNLFLNAGPWNTSMNWGFGGVQLNYGSGTESGHVIATDPAHPIFTGPFTPVVTEYTGNSYSHASIPEQLYTNVLINDYDNPAKLVLVSALWGQGKVFFGGMTSTFAHVPQLEAFNLRANMLYYLGYNPPLQYSIGEDGTTEISVEDIHSGSSDNCGIDTMFLDKYVFSCDELGPQDVTLSVLDINGNTSTCTATVTIVDDMGPSIKGKSIEVFLNAEGKYTLTKEDIATMTAGTIDNCTEAGDLEIGAYPVEFGCIDVGREPAVQLVARDKNGNESKTWVVITVSDTITPAFAPVADVEVVLESGNCDTVAEVEYPEVLVSDNCDVELELLTGLGADAMFPLGATTETWVATDANGNTDTLSFQVIVSVTNDLPTLDTIANITVDEDSAPLTVTLTGISAGDDCVEQTLTVTAASGNTELISSATMSYSEGGTTGSLELTVAPDESGEAEITVTVTDSEGGVVTETFTVTVTAVNDAPFVVTPIADQVVNASYVLKVPVLAAMFDDVDDEVLTIEVMAEGDTLPGWATLTGDTLVFTPMIADTGCINIIVEATDAAGATAADTFRLCVDGYPVSIGEIGAGTFEVTMYPNPTRGAVNIELESSGVSDVDLSVVDITGKVVLRRNYSAAERIMFDMSGKVSGIYFVNLKMNGNQIVKKLVVDRK